VIAELALLLTLQADPRIDSVERLAGNVNRPLLWSPLKVTVASAAGFKGDVVARSGFGLSVAREVTISPGTQMTVLLPALDPTEVGAGKTTFKMPGDFVRPDYVVLVDARLPYAADLASTEKVLVQKISSEDLEKTLSRGLLEAADLILLKEPKAWGVVAPTRPDAEKAIAALTERPATLEAVDRAVWPLAPGEGWVPVKKSMTRYFATLYAFAAYVALAVIARRFPRFGLACVAAVAGTGVAAYGLFPRQQLWSLERSVEVVPPSGEAAEHCVWFLQSASEVTTSIQFPRLVKPLFPSMAGTEDSFTLRLQDRGCAVVDLKIGPGRPACFGGVEYRPPTMSTMEKLSRPLSEAVVARGGRLRILGNLLAGADVPGSVGEEGRAPHDAEFEAWKRFLGRDGLFGVQSGSWKATEVGSPDLVEAEERPRIYIQRFK
jgi:hypothetical protein